MVYDETWSISSDAVFYEHVYSRAEGLGISIIEQLRYTENLDTYNEFHKSFQEQSPFTGYVYYEIDYVLEHMYFMYLNTQCKGVAIGPRLRRVSMTVLNESYCFMDRKFSKMAKVGRSKAYTTEDNFIGLVKVVNDKVVLINGIASFDPVKLALLSPIQKIERVMNIFEEQ